MANDPLPRRWFRFSLRTLFLLVTVLGVWLGLHIQAMRRQKESIAAIKSIGGWCYYDFQDRFAQNLDPDLKATSPAPIWFHDWLGDDFFHNITFVNLVYGEDAGGNRQENDLEVINDLKCLAGFPKLKMLALNRMQTSDLSLVAVGEMTSLEGLFLPEAGGITDEGIAFLSKLHHLKGLNLNGSQVTDESLKILATLPSLEDLGVQNNHFTDRGLAYLSHMMQLKCLHVGLGNVKGITDEGLVHLKGLVNLEKLDLQSTSITAAGLEHLKGLKKLKVLYTDVKDVDSLQKALPNCKIKNRGAVAM